jgi:hypothetical protein
MKDTQISLAIKEIQIKIKYYYSSFEMTTLKQKNWQCKSWKECEATGTHTLLMEI